MTNPIIMVRLVLISVLAIIFWQDIKERVVSWVLYPFCATLFFTVFILGTNFVLALTQSVVNLALIAVILFVSYFYVINIKKIGFLNKSIGLGDILFFISISFGFATVPFIVLFVFSLFFSLVMHIAFKNKMPHKTVPLAGYMALFYAGVVIASFFIEPKYLFA